MVKIKDLICLFSIVAIISLVFSIQDKNTYNNNYKELYEDTKFELEESENRIQELEKIILKMEQENEKN